MQVIQTKKRVHRIGHEFPVKVVRLIADDSVDRAIECVHKDKLTLARAVTDGDTPGLEADGGGGGKWRTTGRIVDRSKFLSADGQFQEDEITEEQTVERFNRGNGGSSSGPTIGPNQKPYLATTRRALCTRGGTSVYQTA